MKPYLIDGPLMATIERKQALCERMAADMAREGVPDCDRDAVRFLMARGFHHLDVAMLAGQARALAYQSIVAVEMSKP